MKNEKLKIKKKKKRKKAHHRLVAARSLSTIVLCADIDDIFFDLFYIFSQLKIYKIRPRTVRVNTCQIYYNTKEIN